MELPSDDKQARLREAGIIHAEELPQEYASVVASLTSDELETLLSIKHRLDLAQEVSGTQIAKAFVAP